MQKSRTIQDELEKLKSEILLKGYTERTLKSYLIHVGMYLEFLEKRGLKPSIDSAKRFLSYLIEDEGYSASSIAAVKAALVFYLKRVGGIKVTEDDLPTPKRDKKLPVVLTREEVRRLVNTAEKDRDKMIVLLLYSTGLRVSELVNLKVRDFDLSERILRVRSGKGKKDRIVVLGERIVDLLRKYLNKHNLVGEDYVFFSKHKRNHISVRLVQKIIQKLREDAGIQKEVTPHVLRHTFATHLLEQGENIRKIQVLLGHANLQTTQIYTKVSLEELKKVRNPLDDIEI